MNNIETIDRPTQAYSRHGEARTARRRTAHELFIELAKTIASTPKARAQAEDPAKEVSRNVVTGAVLGWAPLFNACDVIQRGGRYANLGCSSHEAVAAAEDYFHIPPEVCTQTKVKLGAHHLQDLRRGKRVGRVVHFGGDCEPEVMAQELLRGEGYEVFIVEPLTAFGMVPSRRHEYVSFYAKEAQRLATWLTGKPADEDRIGEEIRARNVVVRKIQEMMKLRLHNPFYVPIVQVNEIGRLSTNRKHEKAFIEAIDLLNAELREVAKKPSPFHIPLVLVGVMHCEDLYEAIDQTIGAVVCGGIPQLYREDLPPLESLGDFLLEMQLQGHMHDKCGGVVGLRRHRIDRELEEFGARGVIVGGTTNCPYIAIAREMEYEYFTQKGIPVLVLDGTAHHDPASEEQKMKLKAFIEMMT